MEQDSRGDIISWVSFELLHRTYLLGKSQRRAEWFARWTRDVSRSDHVHMTTFEEGLGRVMYEEEHWCMKDHAWYRCTNLCASTPEALCGSSATASPFFTISLQGDHHRHFWCAPTLRPPTFSPRADAQASPTLTGVGGWLPYVDVAGVSDVSRSCWFSVEITMADWPKLYDSSSPRSMRSPSHYLSHSFMRRRTRVLIAPTWADNRGYGAALNKLMTTGFPASALLMELAAYMHKMMVKVQVEQSPPTSNVEADALANGDHRAFDPALRVRADSHSPCTGHPSGSPWSRTCRRASTSGGQTKGDDTTRRETPAETKAPRSFAGFRPLVKNIFGGFINRVHITVSVNSGRCLLASFLPSGLFWVFQFLVNADGFRCHGQGGQSRKRLMESLTDLPIESFLMFWGSFLLDQVIEITLNTHLG